MNPRDPQAGEPHKILACYLIINGPLGMSAGKICAQAFQAHHRLREAYDRGEGTPSQRAAYEQWSSEGTRTIARIALTQATFERACRELPGITMIDEGLTEIAPNSPTIHCTWPMLRGSHRLLAHKKIPLLGDLPPRCVTREPQETGV